jgi:hypothetical protein
VYLSKTLFLPSPVTQVNVAQSAGRGSAFLKVSGSSHACYLFLHFFYPSVCEASRELGSEAVLRGCLFYSSRGPEAASVLRGFGGGLDPKSHTLDITGYVASKMVRPKSLRKIVD